MKQNACFLPGLHVSGSLDVFTSIKMQSPSEHHGYAYFIGVNIDLALKQTRQSFAVQHLRCSKQLDQKSYFDVEMWRRDEKFL